MGAGVTTVDHAHEARVEAQARFLEAAGSLAADIAETTGWIQDHWRGDDLPAMRIRSFPSPGALVRFNARCVTADQVTACARTLSIGEPLGFPTTVTAVVHPWPDHLTTSDMDGEVTVTRRFGVVEVTAYRVGLVAELRATPVLAGVVELVEAP